MSETEEDIANLQALLDRSADRAGTHLREVITAKHRISARDLCGLLTGMRL
ncbi:MAG: hypothetical protein ABSG36_06125 [Acidimicrobiales bacterium]